MVLRIIFSIALLACAQTAAWAEDAYLDNRSSAEELVRSLYNAVNNHDYARAFDYFASPPAKDFAAFQSGYEHTARVDVITGEVVGDGAAGSTYFSVPTIIKATDDKGVAKVFIGCYTIRQVNGPIQEPPYRPMQIEKGALKPTKLDDFNTYNLPKCDGAASEPDSALPTIDDAKARFIADQNVHCPKVQDTRAGLNEPQVFRIKYAQKGASASDPLTEIELFSFSCMLAAYNASEVYYLSDSSGKELHLLSFAEPHLDLKYEDDESKKLKSIKVDGFTASIDLTNSEYDEKTNSISSFSKWRGIGDASSNGTWAFADGQFVLRTYDVDPTFDEEQNTISVFSNGQIVLKPTDN
jgi:Protein of unknown function (DUF1176)